MGYLPIHPRELRLWAQDRGGDKAGFREDLMKIARTINSIATTTIHRIATITIHRIAIITINRIVIITINRKLSRGPP